MIEDMKALMAALIVEDDKFTAGNKSAGTRERKILQDIKVKAQDMRNDIQAKKNTE